MPSLSVVLPTFNAAEWLPDTLGALRTAIERSGWEDVQVVVVDDGSTDATAEVLVADRGSPALTVVHQENGGRFRAREAGLLAATGDLVLFIDARVHAHPESLRFVRDQLDRFPDRQVWNGHVHTAAGASLVSHFWDAITFLAWRKYLRAPRLMAYGIDEYDHYPKGTTFFLAPRAWLMEACAGFDSGYADLRHANDDTLLIRPLAERSQIHLSPDFSCTYFPRDSAKGFISHSYHRGTVFVDGYYRPGTRFHRPLQALLVATPAALWFAVRRPLAAIGSIAAASAGLTAAALGAGVPKRSAISLGVLSPVFGVAYGAGIVRGLLLRRRDGRRDGRRP